MKKALSVGVLIVGGIMLLCVILFYGGEPTTFTRTLGVIGGILAIVGFWGVYSKKQPRIRQCPPNSIPKPKKL